MEGETLGILARQTAREHSTVSQESGYMRELREAIRDVKENPSVVLDYMRDSVRVALNSDGEKEVPNDRLGIGMGVAGSFDEY